MFIASNKENTLYGGMAAVSSGVFPMSLFDGSAELTSRSFIPYGGGMAASGIIASAVAVDTMRVRPENT